MLHFILITICVLLNSICLWAIRILTKDMDNLTWKYYLKYLSGIPVGAALSLLLSPITVQNVILFALMGGVVGELLSLFFLTIKQCRLRREWRISGNQYSSQGSVHLLRISPRALCIQWNRCRRIHPCNRYRRQYSRCQRASYEVR